MTVVANSSQVQSHMQDLYTAHSRVYELFRTTRLTYNIGVI